MVGPDSVVSSSVGDVPAAAPLRRPHNDNIVHADDDDDDEDTTTWSSSEAGSELDEVVGRLTRRLSVTPPSDPVTSSCSCHAAAGTGTLQLTLTTDNTSTEVYC